MAVILKQSDDDTDSIRIHCSTLARTSTRSGRPLRFGAQSKPRFVTSPTSDVSLKPTLKANDIVNMRMARIAGAACLLVGDIDRGGVFAALFRTLALLESHERSRFRGFAINKFRGDPSLLAAGVTEMERRLGIPSLGVVPWLPGVGLDEEDSVALEDVPRIASRGWLAAGDGLSRALPVAVVNLPYLANGTDFSALAAEPSIDLAYAERAADLELVDLGDPADWPHPVRFIGGACMLGERLARAYARGDARLQSPPPTVRSARRALRLVGASAFVAAAALILISTIVHAYTAFS